MGLALELVVGMLVGNLRLPRCSRQWMLRVSSSPTIGYLLLFTLTQTLEPGTR
jgi:hypothetical protein